MEKVLHGDCLEILPTFKDESVDLIYLDPPFFTNTVQKLKTRDGSIFVHCDKNSTHIVKTLLDDIFGLKQFQSEIIWYYKRWSNSKKGLLPFLIQKQKRELVIQLKNLYYLKVNQIY